MNQYDLKGRHAIVTGGAQGLGFAMARRFIDSGATVTLWDMNAALLDEARSALGMQAQAVVVDITDYPARPRPLDSP
ncbi:SDR family NAD(P)-dependent oxidoreductase [Rhizobium straminoryzae]|uniref:SDR family NAD(P)-dependent oxidoreductase n=1 Tax=Rhizobium straminoryzae TaxID=1387186 RepID=A0A549SN90_9HYPH|nr:SDR family NAD(P)-dependent oxidoreductase [Rhizobium straminoryzae]TRL31079.1 SDR family NAD(P)-dependent oxidoreductase [Rhizobium straminoryzae]